MFLSIKIRRIYLLDIRVSSMDIVTTNRFNYLYKVIGEKKTPLGVQRNTFSIIIKGSPSYPSLECTVIHCQFIVGVQTTIHRRIKRFNSESIEGRILSYMLTGILRIFSFLKRYR